MEAPRSQSQLSLLRSRLLNLRFLVSTLWPQLWKFKSLLSDIRSQIGARSWKLIRLNTFYYVFHVLVSAWAPPWRLLEPDAVGVEMSEYIQWFGLTFIEILKWRSRIQISAFQSRVQELDWVSQISMGKSDFNWVDQRSIKRQLCIIRHLNYANLKY